MNPNFISNLILCSIGYILGFVTAALLTRGLALRMAKEALKSMMPEILQQGVSMGIEITKKAAQGFTPAQLSAFLKDFNPEVSIKEVPQDDLESMKDYMSGLEADANSDQPSSAADEDDEGSSTCYCPKCRAARARQEKEEKKNQLFS
jgi:hypothetical protein